MQKSNTIDDFQVSFLLPAQDATNMLCKSHAVLKYSALCMNTRHDYICYSFILTMHSDESQIEEAWSKSAL